MRVGGHTVPMNAQTKTMLRISLGTTSGFCGRIAEDGGWMTDGNLTCDIAILVNGDVTIYGLAAVHTLQDIVQRNGVRGATFFFQAEFPHDVNGDSGYAEYRFGSDATVHTAYGVGVCPFFRVYEVTEVSAISTPSAIASDFLRAPLCDFGWQGCGETHSSTTRVLQHSPLAAAALWQPGFAAAWKRW